MKYKADPRHLARIATVQRLFEHEFEVKDVTQKQKKEHTLRQIIEIDEFKEVDKELAEKLFKGVQDNREEADKTIRKYATQWPLDQIPVVDLQILRLALFEGFIEKITPAKVAIDEAIELAKEFGGENSAQFVNGVLGNLIDKSEK